ncbi:MAG: sodium:calcium antiporter [Deltaproteobacteria bacterium]|nr:sodium:calcium antiporter [Deltaproteobacteria bacterium]MBW2383681.1 sodium:calcium antiporter [Deltaproteobacteria bacterium]
MSEGRTQPPRKRRRDLIWFVVGIALPVPWVVAAAFEGLGIRTEIVALIAGLAILGAAFMLSWSCELAEREIPQSLALLVLALVGVLPEYAVDLHFAWTAGKDPSYASYAVANMTGANRLLIGFGWAAVAVVACRRTRTSTLELHPRQRLEIRYLIWATLYSFLIPLSGTINLFDAAVLFTLFVMYVREAMQGEGFEADLIGPAALIDLEFGEFGRRFWAASLFVFAGYAIVVSAAPFAESLVTLGRSYAVDEFLLVQWLAPLASESPEFVVAIIFASKLRGSVGIGALVSSKVNQWTLLVGAIPIAYGISLGAAHGLPLDARQTQELLLTSAQSLLAAILLADLRFTLGEALALATLFTVQLVLPSAPVRWAFIGIYLALSFYLLTFGPRRHREAFWPLLLGRSASADPSSTMPGSGKST